MDKSANVQGFDCGCIAFKADYNMFGRMEIAEYIYEVFV